MKQFQKKAYIDCVGGIVTCLLLGRYEADPNRFVVKITAKNSIFMEGATMHYSAHRVIPRDSLKQTKYTQTILPYEWGDIPIYKQPVGDGYKPLNG